MATVTSRECAETVAAVLAAVRVFASPGEVPSGHHLFRWRALSRSQRAYFQRLLEPQPFEAIERQTVSDGRGGWRVEPPYPEPCSCAAPVVANYDHETVRCAVCLRVWHWLRSERATVAKMLAESPLFDSIPRDVVARALERMQ